MTVSGALAGVLAVLERAGVHAVSSIADVNPPCAYVIPPEGAFRFDRGRVSLEFVLYLVVGDTGTTSATSALSALIDLLSRAGLPFTTFTRDAVNNPGGGDPFPAYRVSWTTTTTIGD